MRHRMLPITFSPDRPPLPWQRNLGQNWLQLGLRKPFLRDFCAYRGVFGMSRRMLPIAFSPDRPPLPWQGNLGQNGL